MKVPWHWLLGLGLLLATAVGLSALQTSLWFLVFGRFAPPQFWLIALVYISVTRPLWEATAVTYLLCAVSAPFTAFPFESLLLFQLSLMVVLILIRERVYWGGSTYFMLMVGVASFSAPILFWILSRLVDKNPLSFPAIFDWLIAGCLTTLCSLPLYRLYQKFDAIAALEPGAEGRIGPR